MKSTEAFQAKDPVIHLGEREIDFLGSAIKKSPRRRSRILAHRSSGERLHEMFVIYSKATYVRPNKHIGKDESVFVIRGELDFVFFDDRGEVTDVVRMGERDSGKAYYCRVPEGIVHTVIMRSEEVVLFEGTPGPFNPSETVYADWAPAEDELEAVAAYQSWLDDQIGQLKGSSTLIKLERTNELVFNAVDKIVALSRTENEYLKNVRCERDLDRLRICVHKTGNDRLHEMLMVFSGSTYVRPSLHIDKEESLFILEGLGTYVFFDESGKIRSAVPLGPPGSGRSIVAYPRMFTTVWSSSRRRFWLRRRRPARLGELIPFLLSGLRTEAMRRNCVHTSIGCEQK
jgi:cupin fold WbuC family metalloprotein